MGERPAWCVTWESGTAWKAAREALGQHYVQLQGLDRRAAVLGDARPHGAHAQPLNLIAEASYRNRAVAHESGGRSCGARSRHVRMKRTWRMVVFRTLALLLLSSLASVAAL